MCVQTCIGQIKGGGNRGSREGRQRKSRHGRQRRRQAQAGRTGQRGRRSGGGSNGARRGIGTVGCSCWAPRSWAKHWLICPAGLAMCDHKLNSVSFCPAGLAMCDAKLNSVCPAGLVMWLVVVVYLSIFAMRRARFVGRNNTSNTNACVHTFAAGICAQ